MQNISLGADSGLSNAEMHGAGGGRPALFLAWTFASRSNGFEKLFHSSCWQFVTNYFHQSTVKNLNLALKKV